MATGSSASKAGAASVSGLVLVVVAFVLLDAASVSHAQLQVGFYVGKCKGTDVEAVIRGVVQARFKQDPSILPALLRMQFHDCFVRGCDASILLDGQSSEKNAGANASVRGYELIDEIKAALEKACAGVVSCADIIVAATRDAVVLGGGTRYDVQTGRRDGLRSSVNDVNLPGPSIPISNAIGFFNAKKISTEDMVLLLGGHTVGITHCLFISGRLWNFNGSGGPDPSMDPALVRSLRVTCPQNGDGDNNPVNLDQNATSANVVDNSFFKQIMAKRGVLQIDQRLADDGQTRSTVAGLAAGKLDFGKRFGGAMVRMGAIEVLTGSQGEVRKSCRAVNKRSVEATLEEIVDGLLAAQ
ncbi:peroxidase 57-like [Zingiber officinale]|nr:peroxidase 57-like [Zingiber officinale]